MTNLREAAQMALEALEDYEPNEAHKVAVALRILLAQPDQNKSDAQKLLKLHEVNAKLMEALSMMLENCYDAERDDAIRKAVEASYAALAKATGENNE